MGAFIVCSIGASVYIMLVIFASLVAENDLEFILWHVLPVQQELYSVTPYCQLFPWFCVHVSKQTYRENER